jgi:hypothetical protein
MIRVATQRDWAAPARGWPCQGLLISVAAAVNAEHGAGGLGCATSEGLFGALQEAVASPESWQGSAERLSLNRGRSDC